MTTLFWKIESIFIKIWHVFKFFPVRFRRLLGHFSYGFRQMSKHPRLTGYFFWLFELLLLLLDLIGICELYETIQEFIKPNTRKLNQKEIQIANAYFGNQLILNRIRVDDKAFLGPPQHRFAYVSFFTINSWKQLPIDVYLHELVHVWQYQQKGIIYMSRAIAAQYGKRGYNYGGIEMLRKLKARNRTLHSFNPEHQAEIVQDHFRLKLGYLPRRGSALREDLEVYDWFVRDLKV